MDQMQLTPFSWQDPTLSFSPARAAFSYNVTNNYIVEPQITYSHEVWKGRLDALAGHWQSQNSKDDAAVKRLLLAAHVDSDLTHFIPIVLSNKTSAFCYEVPIWGDPLTYCEIALND